VQGSLIGVGPALRKARERRGVTIDEASRGTKLRPDALSAMEDERFDELLGEVYVRGGLRTYATYLGLDADKVLDAYAGASGVRPPPPPDPPEGILHKVSAARRRDNYRLAIGLAVVLVVAGIAFGVVSDRNSAPVAARFPAARPADADPSNVVVSVAASHRVEAVVTVDGVQLAPVTIQPGESRTFQGEQFLTLRLGKGGASVAVNGTDLGVVGSTNHPWQGTFSPTSIASPQPSAPTTGSRDGASGPTGSRASGGAGTNGAP
jgi:cytoskeletal protein RodZ